MPDAYQFQREQHRATTVNRLGIGTDLYDRYTALSAPYVSPVRVRKGTILQEAGARATHYYWIASGVARRGHISVAGEDLTLGFITEGENTGSHSDMMGGLQGAPAREFFVAETAVEAWRIDWSAMQRHKAEHGFVDEYYLKIIECSIRRYAANLQIRSHTSAEARLEAFRSQFPGLEQRLTQRALASYLGVTTQYMSRLRRAP
ncbi:Crp/Fnr family transcriptional regulator [Massilia sp. SR12]